jgi:hypothetical protein
MCMNDPRRIEIERLAALTFDAKRERLVKEWADERYKALARVHQSGNAGGYLPALIEWAGNRLKQIIYAQADAYIDAFNACGLPCDDAAERTLRSTASQSAAGSIANVRGDRFVTGHHLGQGVPWHLGIEREMGTAVKEAIARMRMQRATVENAPKSMPSAGHTITIQGANSRVNINSVDNSVNLVEQASSFADLRKAIDAEVGDAMERATIQERLTELELSVDRRSGWEKYAAFMAVSADHISVISPFLPSLHDFIGKLLGGQ